MAIASLPQALAGAADALLLLAVDAAEAAGPGSAAARPHLDHDDQATLPRHHVELQPPHAQVHGDDVVSALLEIARDRSLGARAGFTATVHATSVVKRAAASDADQPASGLSRQRYGFFPSLPQYWESSLGAPYWQVGPVVPTSVYLVPLRTQYEPASWVLPRPEPRSCTSFVHS